MKPPRKPPPDGHVPYPKFHAVVSKWKARALRAEDELRRVARRPIVAAIAPRVVVSPQPKRDAETERQNGFTTADEFGGTQSQDPSDDPV
jgi:hypothetical protein